MQTKQLMAFRVCLFCAGDDTEEWFKFNRSNLSVECSARSVRILRLEKYRVDFGDYAMRCIG